MRWRWRRAFPPSSQRWTSSDSGRPRASRRWALLRRHSPCGRAALVFCPPSSNRPWPGPCCRRGRTASTPPPSPSPSSGPDGWWRRCMTRHTSSARTSTAERRRSTTGRWCALGCATPGPFSPTPPFPGPSSPRSCGFRQRPSKWCRRASTPASSRPSAEAQSEARRRLGLPARYLLAVGNAKPHKRLHFLAELAPRLPWPLVVLAGAEVASLKLPASVARSGARRGGAAPGPLRRCRGASACPRCMRASDFRRWKPSPAAVPWWLPTLRPFPRWWARPAFSSRPWTTAAWLWAVRRLDAEPTLRATLVERGLSRAQEFRWEVCAQRTADVYRAALG